MRLLAVPVGVECGAVPDVGERLLAGCESHQGPGDRLSAGYGGIDTAVGCGVIGLDVKAPCLSGCVRRNRIE